ncbi:hypothetical protein PRUB_b0870 [Pseudoalteromonas rubra]|uniref:Cadherin domain-containing protein n=1 Tax=Pseudoalteromonas rubra TaxID=43658 RepID=A0A8T0C1Q8_9GAMM|nr:Ig-like domain-containing protein [Pseudoalteromonas rubra]KAF7781594.1 hypothetical protein PRUB_b0870 [Pseudoalteromonas rubra]
MRLSKVATAVTSAGISAALFSGNIWAGQKTLDYSSGTGTPTDVRDGSNGVPDISLDSAGAVTFILDGGESGDSYTAESFAVAYSSFYATGFIANSGASATDKGYKLLESSGTHFSFDGITFVRAGDTDAERRVRFTGFKDSAQTVTVDLTPPVASGIGTTFSFTRSSDFNNALWQDIDTLIITFPDTDPASAYDSRIAIRDITLDDATASDSTAPAFVSASSTPNDNATDVSVSSDIVIAFDENIALSTGNITIRNVTDSSDFEVFDVASESDGTTTTPGSGRVSITSDKVYLNPTSNLTGNRTYAIRIDSGAVTDTSSNAFTGISDNTTFNFSTANTTPVVDLDTGSGSSDSSASFSEGSGAVNIASSASATDADSDTITTITVTLTNDQDGASEGLNVTAAAQNALTGVSGASDITLQDTISITGATATPAEVTTFLQAITYNNTSSTPNETARTVTVVINDGSASSTSRTATVSVTDVTAASSTATGFNTSNGTNLSPAITFAGGDETLTIADASHVSGSTASGGTGTDTLSVPTSTNLANLTSLSGFETLTPDSDASITLTESQHESFTTINGAGTNQFTLSSADGNAVITGDADIETYVLGAGFTFTLGGAAQNVTGSSSADTVATGSLTATGTLAGSGGTDVLQLGNGASISGATVSGFETLTVDANASVTMTEAQHDAFSTVTGTATESITISAATDGLTAASAIETYVLGAANNITLSSAGQNVTGSSGNDTIDIAALTATGTLNAAGGTDTLSMSSGASIAGATVSNFENLTLASGASVSMTASQPALFGGTITAAGTETINISGDGDFSTLANVENFSVGDSSTNSRTVTVAAAGTSVTASSSTDAVTFNVGTLSYTGTLTGDGTTADTVSLSSGANISGGTLANIVNLTLASGASVTMTPGQNASFSGTVTAAGSETITISGDGNFTTLTGIETYSVNDDSTNSRTITVTNASATIDATASNDAITFDIAGSAFNGSLTGDATTGDTVSVSDGADVSSGGFTNIGTLSLASGATVSIDAANVANNFTTAITGAAGSETLKLMDGGTFNFGNTSVSEIENLAIGTNNIFTITLTDNFDSNGNSVTISNAVGFALSNAITLNASALSGDTINMTATDFDGNDTITGGSGTDTIRPGGGTDSMTGNAGNDNFVGDASDLNGDTITDLSVGDIITINSVTGLTTSNVRFNGTSTLQVDTDATDFSAVEVAITLSNAPASSLDFTVADNGANTDITFISPNNVPTFSNLNGGQTFTENGSAVIIDSDVVVADTELDALDSGAGNYNNATLTIARNGGASSQDVFANNGLLGTLTESSSFTYNSTTVGTVTTNSSGTLVLTFNTSATSAIVDSVLQNITYQNSSEAPPSSVTLDYTFNDGTANSTGTNQATVTITAQNDDPTDISLDTTSINQSATGAGANIGTLSTTDPDTSDSHTYTIVSSGASANGTCSADTNNGSFQINGSNLETQAALSAGSYVVCLQTSDSTTTFQKAFTVTVNDDVAPDAPSTPDLDAGSDTGTSDSDNNTNDTTPTFSGTAESGSTVRLYSDQEGGGATVIGTGTATGGNWQITTSALTAGVTHAITAKATDASSNESSASSSLSVTIDTTAPSAPGTPDLDASSDTGTSNTDNVTNDTTATFTGSGPNGGAITLISSIDGTVGTGTATLGTWTITTSALSAGTHTMTARSTDTAGNTADGSGLSVTVDTSVSAVSITTPIEVDGIVNAAEDNDVLIAGTGAESGNSVTVSITDNNSTVSRTVTADGSGNWTLSGSELDVSGLNNGSLTVSATQTDTAGNTSSAATQSITLDNAAPSAVTITTPIETDGIVNAAEDNDVLIAGSGAESGNSVTVTITDNNSSVSRTVTADSSGNWTLSGSELDVSGLNNGSLTVSATQADAAGNTSTAATQTITLDNAAPSALTITTPIETDGIVNASEDNDVLIAGSGAESGNSVTVTITDNNSSVSRTVTADSSGNWTLSGSELDVSGLNNGTLTVSATQADTAGNTSTAATQTITLDNAAPSSLTITTPIETDGLVNAAEDNDVLIAGSGAESGNSVTVTITDNNSSVSRTVTADSSGNWTLSGSELDVSGLNNGTLTVSATQADTAGNTSTAATQTITLDNAAPSALTITTPIETDGIVNAAEDNDVLIAGSGAESGNSVTVTITDNNSSVSRTVTADSSGNWTLSGSELDVSGLNNGTLTVSATQADTAGNTSTAATQTVTLDNAAPSALTITTPIETDGIVNAAEDNDVLIAGSGAESGNSVTVTITDNNSSVSRTVTADSSGNWTLSGSELDVSGLNNGTLTVSATQSDTAGNTSTAATQTITLDNAAPSALTITTPIETDGLVNAAEDNDVLIAGSGAESGNSVTVTITDNNSTVSRTVTADSSGNWTLSGSELDVSGLNNGTLTVSATQTDTAGNSSTAATQSITLDNAAPSALTITTPIETDGIVNAAEDNDVLIAGSGAESGNSVTVTITDNNSSVSRTVTADSSGNWTLSGSELDVSGLNNGTLTVSATQADTAGNTSTAATQSITLDNAAPSALTITTPIETDGLVNAAEDNDVLIAGSGAESGNSVTVTIMDNNSTVSRTVTADSSGNWTLSGSELDVSGLNNGTLTVSATQADTAGNTSTAATQTITLDNAAPSALTIITPIETDGLVNAAEDNDVLIAGSGAESGNSVTVTITDNNSSVSRTVTADSSGNWTLSGSELDVSGLNNGTLTVSATQADTAGNTSTAATQSITLDNAAPSALTITTPIETDGIVNAAEDNDVLIAGSGAESGNSVTVTITDNNSSVSRTVTADSSGNWTLSGSELDVSGLNNGTLTVSATQADTAGNTSTAATQTITLDNAAPSALTIITPIETDGIVNAAEDNDVLIAGSGAESGNSVTVTITDNNSTVSRTVTADSSGNWTLSGSELDVSGLNNGTLTVSATQADTAGNTSTAATQSITLDNAAPSALTITTPIETDGIVNAAEDNDVLIAGSGAESGNSVTVTITDNNSTVSRTVTADSSGNWTLSGSELDVSGLNNGTLTVSATQTDTAGNTSTAATQSITLDNAAPSALTITTPIETDGLVNAAEDNDVLIAGSGAESGNSVTVTITDNNSTVSRTVTADSSGNWTLSGSELDVSGLNNGSLTVSATQTDTAGNSSTAATQSITLDNAAPSALTITTPIETDGIVNAAEDNDVLIAGSGAESGNSVTVTITDNNSSVSRTVTADSSGNWTLSGSELDVSGLNNGTLTVSATQTDTAGNSSTAATQSITLDNAAPSALTITTPIETDGIVNAAEDNDVLIAGSGAESGNSVTVTITDNNSSVSRTVTADSSGNWTLSGSELDVSGLNNGTLTVSATQSDTGGNTSTAATQTITLDNAAPSALTITTPIETDGIVNAAEDNDVLIAGSGAESGNSVTVTITDNNSTVSRTVTADSSGNWTLSGNELDVSGLNNGTLTVSATQTDTAGNSSNAATQSITLDNATPSGQSVAIDQTLINRDNESALSFTLSGLEGSGTFTYQVSDGTNTVSSDSATTVNASSQQVTGVNVSTLNEGTLTLTVIVSDEAGNAGEGVTATVTKQYNVAPVLSGTPAATVNEDEAYSFTPTLTDSDDDDTHTFSIVNKPDWAEFNTTTGALTGTPADSDVGTYSNIQISVSDGTDQATLTAFSIEVVNTNDAPVGQDFTFTLDEAATLTVTATNGLLSTATDDDTDSGDTLTASAVSQPQYGQLSLNTDGSFSYQHDGSENHSDSFTYQVTDSNNVTSATQTVTLTITPVADAPTVVDDAATTNEDTAVIFDLLTNDSDPENDLVEASAAIATQPSKGSVTIANGVVTYTPNANETGQDTFTYTVKDAALNTSAEATVTVTITPVNDQPTVQNFAVSIAEDNASDAIAVRAGASDVEDGSPSGDIALATQPSKGSVAIDQNAGTLVYTPNANETGTDTFTYTIADSEGSTSESATVTVNIGAVNDRPVVVNDSVTTNEDVSVTLDILANDSDVEDQGFNGANVTLEDQGSGAGSYAKADVSILTDGTLQITPKQDETGTFSFTYTLTDSEGLSSEAATVTVTLTPVNDAPVAVDNVAQLMEEGSYEVNVLGNDTDVDENDSLDATSVTVVQAPSSGQTQITAAGAIIYTPNADFSGEDTFTYTVADAAGAVSNEATVTMTVTAVNDAPVLSGSPATEANEDSAYSFIPTAVDADADTLTFSVQNLPSWASFDTTNGALTGTPDNDDVGTYQGIVISATDGTETVSLTAFDITVVNTNDAPTIAGTPTTSVSEDEAYTFTPTANDVDVGDSLTFSIANQPAWASFDTQTGTLSGTPTNDSVGTTADIVISVSDGTETVSLAAFSLTVTNTNDAPVISGTPATSVNEDTGYSFVPTASDVDSSDTLTFSVVNLPSWASFSSATGAITGTPVNSDVGTYQGIVISVTDGTETASLDAFTVTVVNVNDAPVISGTPGTSVNEDSAYSFTPVASDVDGDSLSFSIVNQPTWASFNAQTGALSGTPTNSDVGTTSDIVISVSDGVTSASLAAFSLTVANTNDAPEISGSPATSVNEDASYSFAPTVSDVDVGDVLVFSINNQPSWASFNTATGTLSGTPTDADVGTDTQIVITVSDGTAQQSLSAFDIEVINTNDAPTAQDFSFGLDEGQLLTVTTTLGLLSTASDDDLDSGDSLSVSALTQPQHGALTLNADGSFNYQHDGSESTSDSFTFQVTDAQNAASATHTVSLTINPVEDAPTAVDDSATTNEDTAVQIALLDNDSDPEGNMNAASAVVVTAPSKGAVSIVNGIATYTPASNENGQDSFTYTVADTALNTSEPATVVVTITSVNDAPVAANLTISTDEDTPSAALAVREAATDIEDGVPTGVVTLTSTPSLGVVSLDQDAGTLVYTPNTNEVGEETFTYTITDSEGLVSASANITVNIGAINDRPVVGDDTVTTDEDVTVVLDILANDSDVEDQGFNGANVTLEDQGNGAGSYAKADVTILADGTLEIAPKQDETGTFSFTYTLTDSEGLASLPATVSVTLTPVNDAPVAVDNSVELQEEGSFEVNVLGNDFDVDEGDSFDLSSVTVVNGAQNGQTTVTAQGTIIYTANTNYFGDDSFTYTVRDQAGAVSNEATVSLSVTPINDAPVVEGQALSLNEDETLLVTLSGTDPDADTLTYSIVSGVASGALQQQSDTTWLYTPNADFNGSDSFSFMANDGALDSNTATVTLTVNSVNDAPVISGTPDSSVVHNTVYSFTPQASDIDGDALTFAITNQPVWAQFDTATGTLSGTPSRDDEGLYSNIVISVTDGTAQTALSAFEIDVQFVNNQPIANNMDIVVNEDGTTSFVADASDEDGDSVTVSIERQPVSGLLVLQGNTFTYTPFGNFNGLDSFSYIANDGSLDSAAGEVKITINSVNDLPLAVNDSFVFEPQANNTYVLDVLANDTDADAGDVLSIVGAKASVGTVSIADGALSYQAQADTQGLIVIDYLIEDSQKARSKATAQLQINSAPANTLPVITVPTDITTNATGLFTKVSLGTATAVDGNGNTIAVSLVDGTTLFAPGTHFVYWQATDSQGLQSIATQNVFVNPLISLEKDTTVAEEQSHTVNVFLNGPAPSYPVTIPYTVSGTADAADHDLVDGQVVIESGTSAQISFNVFGDGVIEGNENIVITLADSLNRGAKSSSTVTIVEENVAPTISTSVTQAGETRSLLTVNDELVTVTATARDANPQDNVTLSWNSVDNALTNLSAEENIFVFSTSGLAEGIYQLTVTATDDAQPSLSSVSDIYLEVVAELQALTQVDTDGDLIPDDEEGYADSDGDGIPDFQDAITECNVMQEQAAESAQYLVEGEPGVCLRKGATVAQNSTGGVQLLEDELPGDGDAINIGGLFDFIATGLPQAGDTYTIVIPQRRPIPANAVYRKLKNDEWVDFVVSGGNAILSATGEPGYCPPPGSNEWTEGLTEGDWCVQLQIVDGGPNDDDGMANRSVVDPGGIAVPRTNNTLPVATADEVTIASGQQITIDVLENDTDADGNTLTITGATVDFGAVSIVDNKLVYTPPATFVGVATIEYSISDGQGGTSNSQAIVNLTVNSAPTAMLDIASTDDRTSLVIDVLANDSDADGDELFLISAVATHGKATVNIDGTLTYEPKVGFSGEDVIVYQVRDSKDAVSKGIVKVTVSGYQTVSVENKSSGGLGGLLVIMMSALILRRRRNSKLPAYTLLTTSCLLADPVLAEQWRAEAMVGQAEADYQTPTSVGGLTVGAVDDSSESWSAGAYYELMPKWEVGIRYIDLGQGRLALTGESLTPDTVHELAARATPVLPEGFALQTGYELLRHERFSAGLFLGAFDWKYQLDSTRNNKHLLQYEKEGTSTYGGITLGYDVLENTAINVSYSYYNISENAIKEISAGVSLKF